MNAADFVDVVVALRKCIPFCSFTVALANGNRFEVDHADALVVRDGVAIYVSPGGVAVVFDHDEVTQITGNQLDQTEK